MYAESCNTLPFYIVFSHPFSSVLVTLLLLLQRNSGTHREVPSEHMLLTWVQHVWDPVPQSQRKTVCAKHSHHCFLPLDAHSLKTAALARLSLLRLAKLASLFS